jgi:hypothetical protein
MGKKAMPNVTLAMDEELLKSARDFAKSQGTTLNGMIRKLVQDAVDGRARREESRLRLIKLMDESTARLPPDYRFNREELYESPSLSRFERSRLRGGGQGDKSS